MQLDYRGKTAVVTGGANGIGLAAAQTLAACGASVWIFDLEKERPEEAAAGFGARGCPADVTDRASLEWAFAQAGPPDVVVANAGTVCFAPLTETTEQQWKRTIDVNLTGAFHTIRAAACLMKPRLRGAIVITASTNSFDGEADLAAYNATKAGLLGLLHTTANELGPYQVRVNAVCPGLIRTRLTTGFFGNPEVLKPYLQNIPLGRGGETQDVANAIAFLASDLASFITGAALFVDGGQMAAKFGTWREDTAEFTGDLWQLK
jgi:NAD(P)-dependent dehydrogenase (short-subunit alcohol dehydrogenase family)